MLMVKNASEFMTDQIFNLQRKIRRHQWSVHEHEYTLLDTCHLLYLKVHSGCNSNVKHYKKGTYHYKRVTSEQLLITSFHKIVVTRKLYFSKVTKITWWHFRRYHISLNSTLNKTNFNTKQFRKWSSEWRLAKSYDYSEMYDLGTVAG